MGDNFSHNFSRNRDKPSAYFILSTKLLWSLIMIKNIMRLALAGAIATFAAPIYADGHGCDILSLIHI